MMQRARLKIAAAVLLAVGSANAQEPDAALAERVRRAELIFVANGALVRKQLPAQVPLGLTAARFRGTRPLKGKFPNGLGYLDVGLLGFTSEKQQELAFAKEMIVFAEPLPQAGDILFRLGVRAPGKQLADIEAALVPATEKTVAEVLAACEKVSAPLPPKTVVVEVEHVGSWGRGPIWKMQITLEGGVLYQEFAKGAPRDPKAKPQETSRLAGTIPQDDLAKLIAFLAAPGLKEIPAEDAGTIGYTYRTPTVQFSDWLSALGVRRGEPNLPRAIAERVEAIKAKLRPAKE